MINDDKYAMIAERLSVFTFTNIQAFVQILDTIETFGIDIDDVKDYVRESINNFVGPAKLIRDIGNGTLALKKCPECGAPMKIQEVNTCGGTKIPGKWKSVWTCTREPAAECSHQIYNRTAGRVIVNEILSNKKLLKNYKITKRPPHQLGGQE